jgi:hypothetical protein
VYERDFGIYKTKNKNSLTIVAKQKKVYTKKQKRKSIVTTAGNDLQLPMPTANADNTAITTINPPNKIANGFIYN